MAQYSHAFQRINIETTTGHHATLADLAGVVRCLPSAKATTLIWRTDQQIHLQSTGHEQQKHINEFSIEGRSRCDHDKDKTQTCFNGAKHSKLFSVFKCNDFLSIQQNSVSFSPWLHNKRHGLWDVTWCCTWVFPFHRVDLMCRNTTLTCHDGRHI